jgi:hypothetical protein
MHPGLDPALWWPLKTVLRYLLAGQYNLGLVGIGIILAAGATFLGIGTFVFAVYQGKDQWLVSVQHQTSVVIHHLVSKRRELLLVVCWLLCPVILLFIVSKVCGPIYNSKYISSAAPALYLLIAFGLVSIRRTVPEWVWIGVIVILVGPGLQQYYVTDVKSQWRDMAVYIEEHATKDDIVVLVSNRLERVKELPQSSLRLTFSWYSQVELPVCEVDLRFTPDEDSVLDALRQCLVGHESFWLILWDVDPDPHTYIEQMVLKPNRAMIDLESRGTFTDISLYSSHGHDIVSNFLKKQSVIPSCPDWS